MSNGSEEVHILLQGLAYLIFNVVLLFISTIYPIYPITHNKLIDSLVIGTLVMKSAIFISLRTLLINLVAAEVAAALSAMMTIFTSLILLLTDNVTPSLIACRVIVWLTALTTARKRFQPGSMCYQVWYLVACILNGSVLCHKIQQKVL